VFSLLSHKCFKNYDSQTHTKRIFATKIHESYNPIRYKHRIHTLIHALSTWCFLTKFTKYFVQPSDQNYFWSTKPQNGAETYSETLSLNTFPLHFGALYSKFLLNVLEMTYVCENRGARGVEQGAQSSIVDAIRHAHRRPNCPQNQCLFHVCLDVCVFFLSCECIICKYYMYVSYVCTRTMYYMYMYYTPKTGQ